MQTQIELIEYYSQQLKKVLVSHGAESEHFSMAFYKLQGAKLGLSVQALCAWADKETTRLHKKALSDNPAADLVKLETELSDAVSGLDMKSNKIRASVEISELHGELLLKAEGYGDCCSKAGEGIPLLIENADGILQLRIWADINEEDPTHTISLENAQTSNRKV